MNLERFSLVFSIIVGNNHRHHSMLLSDNLHQNPLFAAAIEFPVKNPLPGPKIEFTIGDGHHHLAAHDLPFHMRIGIVLIGIMPILRNRFVGASFSSQTS